MSLYILWICLSEFCCICCANRKASKKQNNANGNIQFLECGASFHSYTNVFVCSLLRDAFPGKCEPNKWKEWIKTLYNASYFFPSISLHHFYIFIFYRSKTANVDLLFCTVCSRLFPSIWTPCVFSFNFIILSTLWFMNLTSKWSSCRSIIDAFQVQYTVKKRDLKCILLLFISRGCTHSWVKSTTNIGVQSSEQYPNSCGLQFTSFS